MPNLMTNIDMFFKLFYHLVLDKYIPAWYKYKYSSLKLIERHTGRGCNTPRLHQKEIIVEQVLMGGQDEEPSSTKGK